MTIPYTEYLAMRGNLQVLRRDNKRLREALEAAKEPGIIWDGEEAQEKWAEYRSWYAQRNRALKRD